MIWSETIEIVYSNLTTVPVFSEEDPDYRTLGQELRLTQDSDPRNLEDDNKRLLE